LDPLNVQNRNDRGLAFTPGEGEANVWHPEAHSAVWLMSRNLPLAII